MYGLRPTVVLRRERRNQAKAGNRARDTYLARMGLLAEGLPEDAPRLISMSEDPFMDGKLVFGLSDEQPTLTIGRSDEEKEGDQPDVMLESPQVASFHCRLESSGEISHTHTHTHSLCFLVPRALFLRSSPCGG